jgi:hypothetical protein
MVRRTAGIWRARRGWDPAHGAQFGPPVGVCYADALGRHRAWKPSAAGGRCMGPEWIVVGMLVVIVALVVWLFARRPRR